MNQPTARPSHIRTAPQPAAPGRLPHWRDDARRVLRQSVLRLGAALRAWRQRGRDRAALQELGAHELRDIGLVRHREATAGERALGRL